MVSTKIKVHKEKGKTEVKQLGLKKNNNHIVFAFSFFNGQSVKIKQKEYNSHYESENDAKKAVFDFFNTLKNISNMNYTMLCSPEMKKQFHYNEFDEGKEIDRIEMVLSEGYGFSTNKIKEFERLYLEFSFADGRRAIGTKIGDNIIEILFIDANHMISIDSCRNKNQKMMYENPSFFGTFYLNKDYKEYDKETLILMLLEDAEKGKYTDLTEFISDCRDIIANDE